MSIKNSFSCASFSIALLGAAVLGACGDDGDETGSDEQVQSSSSGDSSGGNTTRAGSSATTRTGRGGSGGNAAAAPRADAGTNSSGAAGSGTAQGTRRGAAGSGNPGTAGRRGLPPGSAGTVGGAGVGAAGTGVADDAGVGIMVLSDGQIAEFASAANAGEITVGMVAVTRAQTPAVRDYAQTMISAHNTAQARQTAIVNTLGITTSTSPLSEQLSENAAAVLKQLQNASVTDFDILYVRSQIDMHLQVLQALDEQLLPNVSADALRSELVLTRTEVQGHVESARGLLGLLEDLSDAGVP